MKYLYMCERCGNPVDVPKRKRRTFVCPYCRFKNYFSDVIKIKSDRRKE